jgi:hypothetical protein
MGKDKDKEKVEKTKGWGGEGGGARDGRWGQTVIYLFTFSSCRDETFPPAAAWPP